MSSDTVREHSSPLPAALTDGLTLKVSPLRISKSTPMSTPNKQKASPFQRALGEIPPTSQRRNSPSYNQATRKMILGREGSPFDSSPSSHASPHQFWRGRDPMSPGRSFDENVFDPDRTLSPKRGSIENLKKASRVKNSSMYAREQKNEYDPARSPPVVERPLAKHRPLSYQMQSSDPQSPQRNTPTHRRGDSSSKIPLVSSSPAKSPGRLPTEYTTSTGVPTPSRDQPSPTKSSLSNSRAIAAAQAYNSECSVWSEEDSTTAKEPTARPLRRHAKSVTFDAAPPQINEYEMVTPDPSAASGSREGSYDSDDFDIEEGYDREGSVDPDDSFDASLEDTEKTPVVLPEDWRHVSPETADSSLADVYDDVFDGREISPMPTARPNGPSPHGRAGSNTSDGSPRPLPPLPGMNGSLNSRSGRGSFSAAADRFNGSTRSLPTPPQAAAVSKAEILGMRDSSMTLEDRLRLMGIQNSPDQKPSEKWNGLGIQAHENELTDGDEDREHEPDYNTPHISREAILQKVRSRTFENTKIDYDDYAERNYGELADLDPDVPIPSREASSNFDEQPTDLVIKQEKDEGQSEIDPYDITDMYSPERSPSRLEDYNRESSVIRYDADGNIMREDDDDTSVYSSQLEEPQKASSSTEEDDGPPTPKAESFKLPIHDSPGEKRPQSQGQDMSSFMSEKDFDLQLRGLMGGRRRETQTSITESAPKLEAVREFLQRPASPQEEQAPEEQPLMTLPRTPSPDSQVEEDEEEEPSTPDSVIRHPIVIEPPERESPIVPDDSATIRGTGGLKTRPSVTPADMAQMAAVRRQVSGQIPPPIPERSPRRSSVGPDAADADDKSDDEPSSSSLGRSNSFKKMQIDFPIAEFGEDLSLDMDKEFDRVVEAQKKGYLMRQNTKIVVASNRQFSDEKPQQPQSPTRTESKLTVSGSGPTRKPSDRGPTWTTEPWNGKMRRRSQRAASGNLKKASLGPMPPLPGQESNVAGLGNITEASMLEEDSEEDAERGRLFVKVVGVKELDLPLPKKETTYFQLTLDNGLHCVTTSWLELGRNAPIGQEFELVVLNDLEFQLTLQTKLERPKPTPSTTAPSVSSSSKSVGHKKSQSAFGKFWSSPKKRAEKERKEKEEADRAAAAAEQHQREQQKRAAQNPTAWELLHDLVAPDGSFARAYVCLKNHENEAFGRPFTVDVPCFNEWALEDATAGSSVKSKHGGVARRPPYRVGKLTLQLLYVPKPPGAKDDDMPKSMNACIRELKEAEEIKSTHWEGHLSQQGGDCPYWRRRFFRLKGTKLTAYHETTMQPRATINLAKATKLIDDRSALTKSGGGRRKSAFSEEEEGYMFVEEGFRIRFANGEVIDFYADNAQDKEGWMKALSGTVGRHESGSSSARKWCELVLDKERRERQQNGQNGASQAPAVQSPTQAPSQETSMLSMGPLSPAEPPPRPSSAAQEFPMPVRPQNHPRTKSVPLVPVMNTQKDVPPAPLDKSPRHKKSSSVGVARAGAMSPPPRSGAMSPPPRTGAMSPVNRAGAMTPVNRSGAMSPINRKAAPSPVNRSGAMSPISRIGASSPIPRKSGASTPQPRKGLTSSERRQQIRSMLF